MDDQIFDFAQQYPQLSGLNDKFRTVGYVIEPALSGTISRCRARRGLSPDVLWVVASAGGGQHGEQLVLAAGDLARHYPDIAFDVVIGPRSKLAVEPFAGNIGAPANLRLHRELPDLADLHAAADIVISSGGYNSLLESLQGDAHIICVPSRKDRRDEQYVHAEKLGKFAAIAISTDVCDLPSMFKITLERLRLGIRTDSRAALDFGGAENIRRALYEDLGISDRIDIIETAPSIDHRQCR